MKHTGMLLALSLLILTAPPACGQAQADLEAVTQGNAGFALDLYRELRAQEGNLFFSPYSISTALAMTYAGARGETARQMAAVLHFTLEAGRLDAAFSELRTGLAALQRKRGIELATANSLWPQKRYPFLKEYLSLVRKYYRTKITPVDYVDDPADARYKINAWVERETKDKIRNLIAKPPDPLTRLILVNAVYFKGDWDSPFEKSASVEMPFYADGSPPSKVPMMRQSHDFNYAEDEHAQVLELPYDGGGVSMLVILPRERDGLGKLEEALTKAVLDGWTGSLAACRVAVTLPRFKLESGFNLHEALAALGMKDAFDMDRADFSGMDGIPNWLYIMAVVHKAFVEVNEEGTEAAAATGVQMGVKSIPDSFQFRADHPFLFLIRENAGGGILFLGRVSNPAPE
jgi:serpin B